MQRKEFDAESGETAPLLSKLDKHDQDILSEMHEIARTNTNFPVAVQLAIRATVFMCLISMWVWIPALGSLMPDMPSMALVACLFVFTVNPKLGTAIQLGIAGFLGTLWSILHVWFMYAVYPEGMTPQYSATSWCALFGWINFLLFLWVLLWCKCGIGMKMFALSYDIGFCLAFLNPQNTMRFDGTGAGLKTLMATLVACLAAPLMNLVPYVMSSAFTCMKGNAVQASKDTSRLFEAAVAYYCGSSYSITIETELKHSLDLRAEIDGLGGDIGAAWFEGFDGGKRGTVRALMKAHVTLMNKVYDRLRALLIAMQTEDFGEDHRNIMGRVRASSTKVATTTATLLEYVTESATDGRFDAGERTEIQRLILEAKDAVRQLARDFDMSRRLMNKPLNDKMFGESFFVLHLSAYSRLVQEYGQMMLSNPPQGASFGNVLMDGIKGTWALSELTSTVNMNFTVKHFIAILICWMYSVYVDGFGGACVITSVFLMNGALCPDIQGFLNVMNAVILAFLAGSMIFKASCATGVHSLWVLPLIATVLWLVGFYAMFSKSFMATAALFIVALTPFKLVALCPTGTINVAAAAAAEMGVIKANVLAILFVASVQYLLALDRPSMIAVDSMDKAFKDVRAAYDSFWTGGDAVAKMDTVLGDIDAGAGYSVSAAIEPRFFRFPWKAAFYGELVDLLKQVRLDVLMMATGMTGSSGAKMTVLQRICTVPEFASVRDDLSQTLMDAHTLAIGLLSCEGSSYDGLKFLKDLESLDTLEALPKLIERLSKTGLAFPMDLGESLEDDELCQLASVFLMIDRLVKHTAEIIKVTVQYS